MLAIKAPPMPKPATPAEKTSRKSPSLRESAANPAWMRLALGIQPKLKVGALDDPLEQDADAAAERVMRMEDAEVSAKPAVAGIQRKCAACDMEDTLLQRESDAASARPDSAPAFAPAGVDAALRTPGQPLPGDTRAFFEPRFNQDFAGVRVHTGPAAEQSARDIQAQAYTVGRDIVFGAGRFAPKTGEGRHLLAHELSHVTQQGQTGPGTVRRQPDAVCGCKGLPEYTGFEYEVGSQCRAKQCAPAVRPDNSLVCLAEGDYVKILKITQDGAETWLRVEVLDGLHKGETLQIRDRFLDFCHNPAKAVKPEEKKPPQEPKIICSLPTAVLSDNHCGEGDDFAYMDTPKLPPDKAKILKRFQQMPDSDLIKAMRLELGYLAGSVGKKVTDQFTGGSGVGLVHGQGSTLGKLALDAPSFAAMRSAVEASLLGQVKAMAQGGEVDYCKLNIDPSTISRVNFSKDAGDAEELHAVFGGTQGLVVILKAFSYDAAASQVSMELEYSICDDFGVDLTDVTDKGLKGLSDGLKAFWVLQHEREGHRPFIDKIRLTVPFSGTL